MKLILSRKGFDSSNGGGPSPIIDGRLVPLPIPGGYRSKTRYLDIGFGPIVERVTSGRIQGRYHCHYDPMFEDGRCAFGQVNASQSHLDNQKVGVGDLFLFWGLYQPFPRLGGKRAGMHHRIFGCLQVEDVRPLGAIPGPEDQPDGFTHRHPHTLGTWGPNNTLYLGSGHITSAATDELRLTAPGEKRPSAWKVPRFLREVRMTYHDDPKRWRACRDDPKSCHVLAVPRGQEFVCDLGRLDARQRQAARQWIERICAAVQLPQHGSASTTARAA